MNLLSKLNSMISSLGIPVETGIFSGKAPDTYVVLVPMEDTFDIHADNRPGIDVQEVRISVYSKGNYTGVKNRIVRALLAADITITSRQYLGYEEESGYHHYNVDVADYYEMEE